MAALLIIKCKHSVQLQMDQGFYEVLFRDPYALINPLPAQVILCVCQSVCMCITLQSSTIVNLQLLLIATYSTYVTL